VAAQLLRPAAAIYRALARADRAITATERLPVPVVVVGNLIVGGAGKTPTTIALVQHLRERGLQPGVVSRGHGRSTQHTQAVAAETMATDSGDEPLLIHRRTGAPTWVGADRVAAGRALLAAHPAVNIVVADDGLQHHRLHRDVQVIVFDERGVGNGLLLPAGPLREPLALLPPARSVVLYNAAQPSTPWPGHVAHRSVRGLVPLQAWWQGHKPPQDWRCLIHQPVLAVAGIAAPRRFFGQLQSLGLQQLSSLALPDHADWRHLPWPAQTPDVVITEKDAVKLPPQRLQGQATRVWVAPLDFQPAAAFFAELDQLLPP
jgi:tetraacyldisaccharide 4'-kinase